MKKIFCIYVKHLYIYTLMGFRFLFAPLQWGYILITCFRKFLYFTGLLKRHSFDIPVICIGNISVGGTGKTPHTRHIARLLVQNNHQVAILLRGYKRKTTGFIHCSKTHNVREIGDEAYEYVHGIEDNIRVFVCEKRKKGIREIINQFPDTSVILMDDGFQHLAVKAGLNILLTDYLNPYYKDHVLPVGTLREPRCAKKRADLIIVSKTPKVFSPIIARDLIDRIKPAPNQSVAFSYLDYGEPRKVFSDGTCKETIPENLYTVFLIAGVANPYPLEEYIKRNCVELTTFKFPDHHQFTENEVKRIADDFERHLMKNKIIFTTEKDVARLMEPEIKEKFVHLPLFYIPVNIGFHDSKDVNAEQLILDYVGKNFKNS